MTANDDFSTEQQSPWLRREDKRIASLKFGLLLAVLTTSTWLTSSHLNTRSPANNGLQQYLIRDLEFPIQNKRLELVQGFGSLLGREPTLGGGDRTGTYTWVGGVELADTMDKFVSIKGKRVLDLGTGTGVVGLSCMWRGPKEVALTDGADEVLEITKLNVMKNTKVPTLKRNELTQIATAQTSNGYGNDESVTVGVGKLRWGEMDDINNWLQWPAQATVSSRNWKVSTPSFRKYDILLGSEVAYERRNVELLLSTIKALLQPETGRCVLRLTPEITDDSHGFEALKAVLENDFDVISFPDIGEDCSQVVVLGLKNAGIE